MCDSTIAELEDRVDIIETDLHLMKEERLVGLEQSAIANKSEVGQLKRQVEILLKVNQQTQQEVALLRAANESLQQQVDKLLTSQSSDRRSSTEETQESTIDRILVRTVLPTSIEEACEEIRDDITEDMIDRSRRRMIVVDAPMDQLPLHYRQALSIYTMDHSHRRAAPYRQIMDCFTSQDASKIEKWAKFLLLFFRALYLLPPRNVTQGLRSGTALHLKEVGNTFKLKMFTSVLNCSNGLSFPFGRPTFLLRFGGNVAKCLKWCSAFAEDEVLLPPGVEFTVDRVRPDTETIEASQSANFEYPSYVKQIQDGLVPLSI